jgi:DNA integrity scanning protein DisA with diadenylate cyclase activity
MMEFQGVVNLLGAAVFSLLGWAAREMWSAIKELRKDIHKLEIALPRDYVRKDELSEIKELIQKIFDKLDGKVDKP